VCERGTQVQTVCFYIYIDRLESGVIKIGVLWRRSSKKFFIMMLEGKRGLAPNTDITLEPVLPCYNHKNDIYVWCSLTSKVAGNSKISTMPQIRPVILLVS